VPSSERNANAPIGSVDAGIGLVVLGASSFALNDGLSKLLAAEFHVVQVLWARFAFFFLPMLIVLGPHRWLRIARTDRLGLQIARACAPLLAGALIIYGLKLLPLTDVTAILFMTPLLVTALSIPILGERVGFAGWAAVVAGFIGVLVIVRPGAGVFAWAALLPLGTATLAALLQIATRLLRAANPFTTLFYTGLVGTVVTTLMLPFVWQSPSLEAWALLAGLGLLHGAGHLCWILAFARAPASTLAPFGYAQLVAAGVFGFIVFGEVPDAATLLGAGIIVAAGLFVLRTQVWRQNPTS
jgi:drug/metabolite transporter (DMT)-like permease